MRGALAILVATLVVSAVAGCYREPYRERSRRAWDETREWREAAAARGREAMACDDVAARSIGGGGYVVEGCGRRQTYTCGTTAGPTDRSEARFAICSADGPVVSVDASGEARPPMPASSSPDDDARVARSATARCAIDAEATVVLVIAPDGTVGRTETPGLSGDSGSCVVQALRDARFAARGREERATITLLPHAADRSAAVEMPPPSPAAEAAARAVVDGIRDAILACTSGVAVGVVIDWNADGAVLLHLPEARSGTPEDGCIRALSSTVVIWPAPRSGGSVLHAVH